MFIVLLVMVAMEIVDISINKIYLFISSIEFSVTGNLLAFIGVTILFFIGQHFMMNYAGRSIKDISAKQKSHLSKIHKIARIIQYALTAILLLVILQMIITSHYSTRLLISSTWIKRTRSQL